MAELQTKIESARMMVYRAAWMKDNGKPYTVPAAMAKMTCTNVAMEVTTEAVQLLGGNGYMKEYHVERMMRDAKITQIYEGTNEIQKLVKMCIRDSAYGDSDTKNSGAYRRK